jgi:hypothetical protein
VSILYAGIGSRMTPYIITTEMIILGKYMAFKKYLLRTGGALGADAAFIRGCNLIDNKLKEIYYPNDVFCYNNEIIENAKNIAKYYHKHDRWWTIPGHTKRCLIRNVFILLGIKLDSPVDFVICWDAPDTRSYGRTKHFIRMAESWKIPIINMKTPKLETAKNVYSYILKNF